ncbi:MAG: hypothetical protein Q7K45_00715 [Nanoarchaeota archaeon]|nr:hypothetical protein [Nanoarchaeota archaeon]
MSFTIVIHKVLEASAKEDILRRYYDKESLISFNVAQKYRELINPVQRELPFQDIEEMTQDIKRRVKKELELRISKGYEGINLNLIEQILENLLRELKIKRL